MSDATAVSPARGAVGVGDGRGGQSDDVLAFYERLVTVMDRGSRERVWTDLLVSDGEIAFVVAPRSARRRGGVVVDLAPPGDALDRWEGVLTDAGGTIVLSATSVPGGRRLQVVTPDGVVITVTETVGAPGAGLRSERADAGHFPRRPRRARAAAVLPPPTSAAG